MRTAFSFPVRIGFFHRVFASAATASRQLWRLGPRTWFETGTPTTTNSRYIIAGLSTPAPRAPPLTQHCTNGLSDAPRHSVRHAEGYPGPWHAGRDRLTKFCIGEAI